MESFLSYLAGERRYSNYTIISYRRDLLLLRGFIGETTALQSIDSNTLRGLPGWLSEQGFSRRSIARRCAAAKSFFKFAYRMQWLPSNPADQLTSPKLEKSLPKFIDEDKLAALLDTFDMTKPNGARNGAILELTDSTGIAGVANW